MCRKRCWRGWWRSESYDRGRWDGRHKISSTRRAWVGGKCELDVGPRVVEIEPAREEPLEQQDSEGEDTGKLEKKT